MGVIGKYEQRQHAVWRRFGSWMFGGILDRAYGKPKGIVTTSFRALRRPLVEAVLAYRTAKPQLGPLIVSITDKVRNVAVRHDDRRRGAQQLQPVLPAANDGRQRGARQHGPVAVHQHLRAAVRRGSIVAGIFYFVRWLTGGIGMPGFTTQILLTIFFGGMMLLGIGVVGEYVGRIIAEVSGPERWQVAASCRCRDGDDHG